MYSLINKPECHTSFKIRDAADNPMDKDQRMMIDRSFSLARGSSRIFGWDESLEYENPWCLVIPGRVKLQVFLPYSSLGTKNPHPIPG